MPHSSRKAGLRRLLWAALVLGLVMTIAGVHTFILRPQAILDRAEQVMFRRAGVTFVSQDLGDRYFFVSNRLADPDVPPVENVLSR